MRPESAKSHLISSTGARERRVVHSVGYSNYVLPLLLTCSGLLWECRRAAIWLTIYRAPQRSVEQELGRRLVVAPGAFREKQTRDTCFGVYKLKELEQAKHLIFKIGDVITLVEENISKYKIQMKDFHLQLFLKLQQKNLIPNFQKYFLNIWL